MAKVIDMNMVRAWSTVKIGSYNGATVLPFTYYKP